MDDIKNFIDAISKGDNVSAQEYVDSVLSAKAFDALETRKHEIAGSLFTGQTETAEE
jgi:hypothetical protein